MDRKKLMLKKRRITAKPHTLVIVENKINNSDPDLITVVREPNTVFVEPSSGDDQHGPAYKPGWEVKARYCGKTFDEAEAALQLDWEKNKTNPKLSWDEIKVEARNAWDRSEE
jgi:hypothetical protein